MSLPRMTLAAGTLLSGCASAPHPDPTAELAAQLSGYFSSAAQAGADRDFFNIELRVVPIWRQRSDGPWLYVEQADASTPDKPYRQRVYRLERQGETYLSHIYTLKGEPLAHAGQWRAAQPLAALGPADLTLKDGCAVLLRREAGGRYSGATAERACPSELRGARFASSKVTLDAQLLESWDQGWNEQGQQVWGAKTGPYRFVKFSDRP